MWRKVIGDLARDHRVLAPDLRGAGWSDAPPGSYSKMGLAEDVDRLLDELGVASCAVVGHDWGALVAWLLAVHAPQRVERLVAFSNVHLWPRRTNLTPRAALSITYQFPLAAPVVGERIGARAMANLVFRLVGRGIAPEDAQLFAGQYERRAHAAAASALYRTFLTREAGQLFGGHYADRRVEQPVLLATGRHDPVVTPGRQEGGEDHAPNMRKAVIEGAGHFVVDEKPEEVVRLIREGLAR
jgi:pimeloyl-ACP methyl ester carboxylesterase